MKRFLILLATIGLLGFAAQAEGWPWTRPVPTAALTADPAMIKAGESSTLLPVFTGGAGSIDGVGVVESGKGYKLTPAETTEYPLTVKAGWRRRAPTATASATVIVEPPPLGKWQVGYPASVQTVKAVTADDAIVASVRPAPEAKALDAKVNPAAARGPPPKRMRGLTPTPKGKLQAALKAGDALMAKLKALPSPPENFDGSGGVRDFTMYGNDAYGDCVTAEEAAAKAVISAKSGAPELRIPDANVIAYCRKYGGLNGANLDEVLQRMTIHGLKDAAGREHKDDPNYVALDYSKRLIVQLAIYYTGQLKIAIAADQVQNADNGDYGWVLLNARQDGNIDHCVGICGYGTLEFCCATLGSSVPRGADPKQFCVILYTWATLGIVDWSSFQAITSEVWMRGTDPDRLDATAWNATYEKVMADITGGNVTPPNTASWTVTYPEQAAIVVDARDAADAISRVPYTGKPSAVLLPAKPTIRPVDRGVKIGATVAVSP